MSKIITILGFSGSGKDTVKRSLPYPHVVSYRTRPIRIGEVDGRDGYFVTDQDYEFAKKSREIVAETVYNGHRYWTTRRQFTKFLEKDIPIIYVVDGNGILLLKEHFGEDKLFSVWLDVPTDELIKRMSARGDSEETIQNRLNFHQQIAGDIELCEIVIDGNRPVPLIAEDIVNQFDKDFEKQNKVKKECFRLNGKNFHGMEALRKCISGIISDGHHALLMNINNGSVRVKFKKEYGDHISFI